MPTIEHVQERINAALPDSEIMVADTTGGGDHFRVEIASTAFAGLSRIEQHRLVYGALKAELADGSVHALSIKTVVPTGRNQS